MSAQPSPDDDQAQGKKRKLYSSCDTCKLRRVKCERESDDQPCVKCVEKGIHCTTAGPKRKKPRTGKRIEQAKELFGNRDGDPSSAGPSTGPAGRSVSPEDDEAAQDFQSGEAHELVLSNNSTESKLSIAELNSALCSHLIEVYFTLTNYPLPLYRWKDFRKQFEEAGRKPENMSSPLATVMAYTIMSHGAYASNSPAILGPGAPSLSNIDAEEANFIHWGRKRQAICESLVNKAVRLGDEKGIFRLECNESIVILLLIELLVDHGDISRRKGRPYRAAAAGHARTLSEEGSTREEYIELQGGGLGWMLYLRDTIQAAMSGREPRLRDQDIQLLCGRSMTLGLPTVSEFSRALNGEILIWDPVMRVWDHVASLLRKFAIRMAKEAPVPESRDDPYSGAFIREVYKDLDETKDCIKLMQSVLSQFFTFKRPGHNFFKFYCRTMTMGALFLDFLVHRALKQEIETLNTRLSHAEVVPSDEITNFGLQDHEKRKARLLQLKDDAEIRMQRGARELVGVLWSMQNSLSARTGMGIMTGVSIMYEAFPTWAEILCGVPSAEEGGAPDYTLATKIKEVGWLVSVFRSIGWAWADMAEAIAYVERKHEELLSFQAGLPLSSQSGVMLPVSSMRSSAEDVSPNTQYSNSTPDSSGLSGVSGQLRMGTADFMGVPSSYTNSPSTLDNTPQDNPIPLASTSMGSYAVMSMGAGLGMGPYQDMYSLSAPAEIFDGTSTQAMPMPASNLDLQQWQNMFVDPFPVPWTFDSAGPSGPNDGQLR